MYSYLHVAPFQRFVPAMGQCTAPVGPPIRARQTLPVRLRRWSPSFQWTQSLHAANSPARAALELPHERATQRCGSLSQLTASALGRIPGEPGPTAEPHLVAQGDTLARPALSHTQHKDARTTLGNYHTPSGCSQQRQQGGITITTTTTSPSPSPPMPSRATASHAQPLSTLDGSLDHHLRQYKPSWKTSWSGARPLSTSSAPATPRGIRLKETRMRIQTRMPPSATPTPTRPPTRRTTPGAAMVGAGATYPPCLA